MFAGGQSCAPIRGPGESYGDTILRLAAVGHEALKGSRRANLLFLSP
jgi:hypothetical protein